MIRRCPEGKEFSVWFHHGFVTLYKPPFTNLSDGLVSEEAETALMTNNPNQNVCCASCLFPEGCTVRFFNNDGKIDLLIEVSQISSEASSVSVRRSAVLTK